MLGSAGRPLKRVPGLGVSLVIVVPVMKGHPPLHDVRLLVFECPTIVCKCQCLPASPAWLSLSITVYLHAYVTANVFNIQYTADIYCCNLAPWGTESLQLSVSKLLTVYPKTLIICR